MCSINEDIGQILTRIEPFYLPSAANNRPRDCTPCYSLYLLNTNPSTVVLYYFQACEMTSDNETQARHYQSSVWLGPGCLVEPNADLSHAKARAFWPELNNNNNNKNTISLTHKHAHVTVTIPKPCIFP